MKNKALIYLAGAVAIYFLLKKKKKVSPKGQVIVEDSVHVGYGRKAVSVQKDEITLNPIIDRNEYFKTLYNDSKESCSY